MRDRGTEIIAKYKFFAPRVYGLECDEGWYPLLDSLFEKISKLNPPDEFKIVQVKEKFGTLRVYTDFSDTVIENLITQAEALSEKTCERCGKPGAMSTNGGWMRTLCAKCRMDAGYELDLMGEEDETDSPENQDQDGNREEQQ